MNNVSQYVQSNGNTPKVSISVTTPSVGQFTMPRVQNPNLVLNNGCYPSAYYINSYASPMIMRLNQAALANQMTNINKLNEENAQKEDAKDTKQATTNIEPQKQVETKTAEKTVNVQNNNITNNTTQTAPMQHEVVIPKELVEAMEKIAKNTTQKDKPKMELTDNYVRNLEKYLNSQDKKLRMLAGQDIIERLQEDSDRRDNPALTALTNKMLQDPEMDVRCLSLGALNANLIEGNDLTAELLKKIAQIPNSQEADYANKILLRLS